MDPRITAEVVEEIVKQMQSAMARELQSSMAEMQRQINEHTSPIVERLTRMVEKCRALRSSIPEDLDIDEEEEEVSLEGSDHGSSYRQPPPSQPSLGLENRNEGLIPNTRGSNLHCRKLEMPWFDGNNSDGWINEAERYFFFYKLPENDKLEAAVMALDGDALLYYEWEHRRRLIRDWEELKGLIRRQYRSPSSPPPPWSSPPPLPVIKTKGEGVIKSNTDQGDSKEKQPMDVRMTNQKTAPLKQVTEEGFLGQQKNGLKNQWAETGVLGSRTVEPMKESGITNKEKLSPHASKSTELNIATQAQSAWISPFLTFASPSPTGTPASITIADSIPGNQEVYVFKGHGTSVDQNTNLRKIKATTTHKFIPEGGGILPPEFALLDSRASRLRKDGSLLLQFAPAVGVCQYDWSRKQVLSLSVVKIRCLFRLCVKDSYVFFHEPSKDWLSIKFEVEISNELGESVKAIIQLILEVCSSLNLDSNTSHQAIQIILGVGKYKSSSLDKNKLIIPVFHVMCPLITEATNREEDDKFSDSLIFKDDKVYSEELAHDAETLCKFKGNQPGLYSAGGSDAVISYNLNMHWNKCLWAESWMYAAMVIEVDRRVGATTTVTGRGGAFVSFCHDGSSKVKFLGEAGNKSGFYIQPVKDLSSILNEIGKVHIFVHEKMQWVLVTDGTRNSITHPPHEVSDTLLTSSFFSPYVDCKSIVPSNYNLVGSMVRFCNLTMRANGQMNCNWVADLLDQRINKSEIIERNWEGQMGIIPVEKVDHAKEKTLPIVDEMHTSRKDANASNEKLKEHWKPMPAPKATGEESMYPIFPSFHLEDKVNHWGWGIVTHQVYSENLSKGILGNSAIKGASD